MIWLVLVLLIAVYVGVIFLLKYYDMYAHEGWPINLGPLWVTLGGIVIGVVFLAAVCGVKV